MQLNLFMHKLRVGIIVDLSLLQNNGGAFSYYQSLLNGINNFTFDQSIEIINIVFYKLKIPEVLLTKPVVFIKGDMINSNELTKKIGRIIVRPSWIKLLKKTTFVQYAISALQKVNISVTQQLANNHIDLIYYLKPEYVNTIDYPFITTHWDIGHKSTHSFPELSMNGSYERRENYYSNILNKALLILCESEEGRAELRKFYTFKSSKIKVLPIFGNSKLYSIVPEKPHNILSAYQLKENRFFLYPAQFWASKNHYNLLLAFKEFKKRQENKAYKLVLCGSDQGNLTYIKSIVEEFSLNEAVVFTGFVTEAELNTYYRNATALVMPTFLGPTNMPLIEAAHLRCPVLCSNLSGHIEIMEGNAIYFVPEEADSIERALTQITNDEYRSELIETAFNHIKKSKFNLENSLKVLNSLLLEIKPIRKNWGY
ncbi:MAG TPA: glycosyltransferase family 1 protein [Sphingobacteriaceae bacterium]|nr:glycosyltransferase family 1 protein [Sphingobacteriaceae bacterium]